MLVIQLLGKLRNALSVGVGLELEALAFEQSLQFLVVRDDTVVDDSKLPLGVGSNPTQSVVVSPVACPELTCADGN